MTKKEMVNIDQPTGKETHCVNQVIKNAWLFFC